MDTVTVLAWIEATRLSVWIRESQSVWVFPFILILHTVGLAFLVGVNVAFDVRLLGVARGIPLKAIDGLLRLMWWGFWVNAGSGMLLLAAYPTKALTNPVFFAKLGLIAVGMAIVTWFRSRVRRDPGLGAGPIPVRLRVAAAASLLVWGAAITTGRLLAYTHTRLMATDPF
jgi:hypothetical protein